MCATLRHEIPEAVVTYEEKPREQWIFDYPAQVCGEAGPSQAGSARRGPGAAHGGPWAVCLQVALTCTQIWWTTEVGLAFARLEEGYENAIKDYNKKQVCGPREGAPPGHRVPRPGSPAVAAPVVWPE